MLLVCLLLIPLAACLSLPLCALLIRLGHRYQTLDGPGVAGQIKAQARRIPNTGGIAIVAAFVLPILGPLLVVVLAPGVIDALIDAVPALEPARAHIPGLRDRAPLAGVFLGAILILHVLGVIDDRRPLGPWLKLGAILAAATAVALTDQSRLLTLLDPYVGGAWLSVAITVLWIGVVTNAFNFMDNMDGLSGGTALWAAACFLAASILSQQWFIASCLALLIGALLGFLWFNFPPARVFMGDGGSLVIGFVLAVLTVRTTYYDPAILDGVRLAETGFIEAGAVASSPTRWHAVFMPLVILAVPLYDFLSVTIIRLSQGRSPFVGDLQHFSHRLVKRGLSKRAAVLVIWGFTLVTGISGVTLASLEPWQAVLVGVQTALILGVIAAFEYASSDTHRKRRDERSPPA